MMFDALGARGSHGPSTVTIYVVGNCQATIVMRCLALMNRTLTFVELPREANVDAATQPDDLILWQHLGIYPTPPTTRAITSFPTLYFNAFHPDLVRVNGPSGLVPSPLGHWHSSLAVAGWSRGLGVRETMQLFSESAFEQLGFFEYWDTAATALTASAGDALLPLTREFERWSRAGCFMHSVNHPKLHVLADVARAVAKAAQLPILFDRPEDCLADPLLAGPVWPIYPEIAERLGVRGDLVFKPERRLEDGLPVLLDLEEFVTRSFDVYAGFARDALTCDRLNDPAYRSLDRPPRSRPDSTREHAQRMNDGTSPYEALPAHQFWRTAVAEVAARDVDPFIGTTLPIDRQTMVATAGSCFAQHLSGALESHGYKHFVAEAAPRGMSPDAARRLQYGVYSARYGNVYTARQLVQLFDRAYGTLEPHDVAWRRRDGRFADPFRPEIEPEGFAAVADLLAERAEHLAAVRTMFEELDVFSFTLGLTEAWRATADGAVFPLAPGVGAGTFDSAAYEFHNFSLAEVGADLDAFLLRLANVNAAAHVILTVSPVPLVATYEPRHVLLSTTASKAILRAAADEVVRSHAHVHYFPAFEIVNGAFNRGSYYESDLRSPTPAAVAHVMRVFFAHVVSVGVRSVEWQATLHAEIQRGTEVLCDEELLDVPARPRRHSSRT